MGFFSGLILGLIIGAGIMLFVYKNNKTKLTKFAEGLEKEVSDLKSELAKKDSK